MPESALRFKPRRLLMTADTVGGVWTYTVDLARSLAAHHIEIALATMGGPLKRHQREQVRALANVCVFESHYRLEWMEDPWRDVERAGHWLLDIEERMRPDLIHLNNFAHGTIGWSAPVLVVGHSCVLSWWHAVRGSKAPASWDGYREAVAQGLRAAQIVVAPTKAMLGELQRYYGPLAAARVIANSGDAQLFTRQSKQPFILAVGRLWDEAKNLAALERVAPHLAWPVYVAGDRTHPDGGTTAFTHVRLLGYLNRNEVAGWCAQAAIFALPARYEPFGLAVLEAANAECALVLGDIVSLRETWEGAALFVAPDDDGDLRAALQSLIEDPTRRKALAARARFRAREFTPERMAASYLSAYSDLLAAHPPGREEVACA